MMFIDCRCVVVLHGGGNVWDSVEFPLSETARGQGQEQNASAKMMGSNRIATPSAQRDTVDP